MKNPLEQIKQLPNGDNILCLFNTAKQELGNSALTIRDYNEHDEMDILKRYGRYERERGIIWIQMRHPDNVIEYTLAHEIGHVMQDAKGFPRVSIRDILRVGYAKRERSVADIILFIHKLTDKLSNLFLDPGADSFARVHNLCSLDALLYMKQKDLEGVGSQSFPAFDRKCLEDGINEAINSIKGLAYFNSWLTTRTSLDTAIFATVYADLSLRYSQEGLFDSLDGKYKQNQLIVQKLGNELLDIVRQYELNTVIGCQKAAIHLIDKIGLPSEAVGLRTFQEWVS